MGGYAIGHAVTEVDAIRNVALCYPEVKRVVVFGSRARGDHGDRSDYDLYVEFDYSLTSWIRYTQLITDLEAALDSSVDLISGVDVSLRSPVLWAEIQKDGVLVYERKAE